LFFPSSLSLVATGVRVLPSFPPPSFHGLKAGARVYRLDSPCFSCLILFPFFPFLRQGASALGFPCLCSCLSFLSWKNYGRCFGFENNLRSTLCIAFFSPTSSQLILRPSSSSRFSGVRGGFFCPNAFVISFLLPALFSSFIQSDALPMST